MPHFLRGILPNKILRDVILRGLEIQNPHNIFCILGTGPTCFISESLNLAHCLEFVSNCAAWKTNIINSWNEN